MLTNVLNGEVAAQWDQGKRCPKQWIGEEAGRWREFPIGERESQDRTMQGPFLLYKKPQRLLTSESLMKLAVPNTRKGHVWCQHISISWPLSQFEVVYMCVCNRKKCMQRREESIISQNWELPSWFCQQLSIILTCISLLFLLWQEKFNFHLVSVISLERTAIMSGDNSRWVAMLVCIWKIQLHLKNQ